MAGIEDTIALAVIEKLKSDGTLKELIANSVSSSVTDAIAQQTTTLKEAIQAINVGGGSTTTPGTGNGNTGGGTTTPGTGTTTPGTGSGNTGGGTTVPDSGPKIAINDFTNEDWDRGILNHTYKAFSAKLEDVQKYGVGKGSIVRYTGNMQSVNVLSVEVSGQYATVRTDTKVDAALVGAPGQVEVLTKGASLDDSKYDGSDPKPSTGSGNTGGSNAGSGNTGGGTTAPSTGGSVTPPAEIPNGDHALAGMNMSGLGNNPYVQNAQEGTHYRAPQDKHFAKYAGMGCRLYRLPISPERMFPDGPDGQINTTYVSQILAAMDLAAKYNAMVIPEFHTYYRWWTPRSKSGKTGATAGVYAQTYNGVTCDWFIVGTPGCMVDAKGYAKAITRALEQIGKHKAYLGFGAANEPHNRGESNGNCEQLWIANAQLYVDAIAAATPNGIPFICGNGYATARNWPSVSDALKNLKDTNGRLVYEAHHYMDSNMSGGGAWNNRAESIPVDNGIAMVSPFIDWCKKNGKRGYIGEHGYPEGNTTAAAATDKMMNYLVSLNVMSTQWCAGPGAPDNDVLFTDTEGMRYKTNIDTSKKYFGKTSKLWGPVAA